MKRKAIRKGLFPYLMIGLIMVGILIFINIMNTNIHYLTYDKLLITLYQQSDF